jgi:prepilin-type N-terminal cleavage/methylation domain-containing protein
MKRNMRASRKAGFTLLEVSIVIAISMIITVIAVSTYLSTSAYLRVTGDLRSLNGVVAQAKMRAASDFTRARAYADLNGNSYQLQVWFKNGNCWVLDSDPTNTCIAFSGSAPSGAVFTLAQGDQFGFGTIASGPTPGQANIIQGTPAAQCLDSGGNAIGNTACILFNSRGIPINPTTLAPTATGALYLTNRKVVTCVTVSGTGSIQAWSTPTASAHWMGQ